MLISKTIFITFVGFQKADDYVQRETLINTIKKYGVDQKTLNLIKGTIIDTSKTVSRVKFLGGISDPFETETRLRQDDGLNTF